MSAICVVNLKEHTLSYKNSNDMAKKLVEFALEKDLGVLFHTSDYAYDFMQSESMKNCFLLSDSFLSENCEFLEESYQLLLNIASDDDLRNRFYRKYGFFQGVIDILFQFGVNLVEIYISENGMVESVDDFSVTMSTRESFLDTLYQSFLKNIEENEFPSVKYVIQRQG